MLRLSVTLWLLAVAFPALAPGKVVTKGEAPGFAECDVFFYERTPPEGFHEKDQEEQVKICQKYEREPRFATLYSTRDKIPLYSAFRYTEAASSGEQKWLVEPQIDDPKSKLDGMMPEDEAMDLLANLGKNQALRTDYMESGYERGELNPSSLHKGDEQVATYTLTNSVPMVSPLEEIWHWEVENIVSRGLAPHCRNGKDLYLISGAVPSTTKAKDKVTVPESLWLAACCDDGSHAWSLGFMKQATTGNHLEDLTTEELEKKLPAGGQLFKNKCGKGRHNAKKLEEVRKSVKKIQKEAPVPQQKKSTKSKPEKQSPAKKEEKGFLSKLFDYIIAPLFQLVKFVFQILLQIVKYIFYFVWRIIKAVVQAVYTFVAGITKALVCIFVDLAQVGVNILNGIAKNIYNVLMITYKILSVPLKLILDIVSFPFHVLGAIPGVLKDIASGVGKGVILIINAITSVVTGLNNVISHIAKKILPKFCDV